MGELGEVRFRIYKLGELGEVSFGMLKLGELGEVSFGKYKLGELDKVSFGILNTTVVVTKMCIFLSPQMCIFLSPLWARNVQGKPRCRPHSTTVYTIGARGAKLGLIADATWSFYILVTRLEINLR